jgi:UMF1 family MFS transporter
VSTYSVMIPRGREAEYFSVYEISEREASWMGPLLFGLALQFAGSYRMAILSVAIFLLSGLSVLSRVDVRRAAGEAGNGGPSPSLGHVGSGPDSFIVCATYLRCDGNRRAAGSP